MKTLRALITIVTIVLTGKGLAPGPATPCSGSRTAPPPRWLAATKGGAIGHNRNGVEAMKRNRTLTTRLGMMSGAKGRHRSPNDCAARRGSPLNRAPLVLASLTALALSVGLSAPGAAQTTCGTPDLGGRVEVWSATLTVKALSSGTLEQGYGYMDTTGVSGGELSDTTFDLDSRTLTITEIREAAGQLRFSSNVERSLLPSFTSLRLHFCDTSRDFSDGAHQTKGVFWTTRDIDWSATSTIEMALSLPSNSTATGHPAITGMPQLRSTLTAGPGTIADANGLDEVSYSYQWVRVEGTTEVNIPGATAATYIVTSDDIGETLKVVLTFTDDDGYPESRSSSPIGPVTALSCSAPSLGNRIEVWNATLTVKALSSGTLEQGYGYMDTTGVSGGELSDTTFDLDSRTLTITEIREAAGQLRFSSNVERSLLPSFTSLRLHFCDTSRDFSDGAHQTKGVFWTTRDIDWSATSTIEMALSAPPSPNNEATGRPTISGTAQVGQTLTASTTNIEDDDGVPSLLRYQWVRVQGAQRTNIGADQRTYTISAADAGSAIQVEVRFTDDAGNREGPLRSLPTDVVPNVDAPPAPGKPRVYGSTMQSSETTKLDVEWRRPNHLDDDPPEIDSYDVRYRVRGH